MTVRVDGRAVPVEPAALAAAFPGTGGRVAVFLHGLTETEDSWGYGAETHHGDRAVTYGSQLQRDLGLTPVYLRYNTGLHISENGRSLDALLGALVEAWPVPVQDVVLVGHSMGGLVARSALHQAGRRDDGGARLDPARPRHGHPGLAPPRRAAGARRPPADRAAGPAARDAPARPAAHPAQRRDQGPAARHPRRGRLDRPRPRRAHPRRAHPRAAARRRPALRRPGDAEPQPRGPGGGPARRPARAAAQRDAGTPGTTTGWRSRPTTCTASAACTTSTC